MSAENLPRNILAISAGIFGFFGLWATISPEGMTALVGVQASGPDGVNDLRAMYGGLELGIAAVLAWHASAEDKVSDGLKIAALSIGGIGAGRLLSMLLTGFTGFSLGLALLELGSGILCGWFSQRA